MNGTSWLLLVINLPGSNKTFRMRLWRALKAAGAVSLRDGVYLLPDLPATRDLFEFQGSEVTSNGGAAHVLPLSAVTPDQQRSFLSWFDRTPDYVRLKNRATVLQRQLPERGEAPARRELLSLRRDITELSAIDFFPGPSRLQVEKILATVEAAMNARFSPGEPQPEQRRIARRPSRSYQARIWATRERLWVDRVCSAWLIRRFIDSTAQFLWLRDIRDCPRHAVGFDFDGAEFTHVADKVTFEVLLASFGLEADPGLARMAALVHYLDVGGLPVDEAPGFAAVMAGARETQSGDDELLQAMSPVLDNLYAAFSAAPGTGTRDRYQGTPA